MYCSICGHKNEQGTAFCSKCGAALSQSPQQGYVQPPIYTPQPQQIYPTPYEYEQQLYAQKKRIRGLIVGICITSVLSFFALIVLIIAIPSFIGTTDTADNRVDLTNARAMATAVNAYNALNPDDKMVSGVSLASAKSKAHDLWPIGVTDEEASWDMITVSKDGFTTVSPD